MCFVNNHQIGQKTLLDTIVIVYLFFGKFHDLYDYCVNITKDVYVGYKDFLLKKPIEDITVNTRLKGIKTFFNFCIELGYMKPFKMDLITVTKKVKEIYTDEELSILTRKPNLRKCKFTEYRNWVITMYLLATGNRASTVRNIKIKDVDLDNNVVILRKTKNHKQQLFPISPFLRPILQEYLSKRGGEPEDYLFCNIYNEQFTLYGFSETIRKYNLSRGVRKTSTHLYRHTFARKVIQQGADIYDVKTLLGHKTLYMSLEYIDEINPNININYPKYDPLQSLNHQKKAIKGI